MEIWVRLLPGQQLSLNVPLTLSLLRKTFCSSWPACGSTWYSWDRWDLLCILPPLQILNSLHFLYINSRLCFQQFSGSHPVCNAVLKGRFQGHFEYVIFYSWKASIWFYHLWARHSAEPQEENLSMNRYGVHNKDHDQCSCILSLFLLMANIKSCEADASVWAKAGKKLFVSLLEKGRRKGHTGALLAVAESQCALQCFSLWCCWGCPAIGWGCVAVRRGISWRAQGKHRSAYLC